MTSVPQAPDFHLGQPPLHDLDVTLLPIKTQRQIALIQSARQWLQTLEGPQTPISERLEAYLRLSTSRVKNKIHCDGIPSTIELSNYLDRDRTSIVSIRSASRVNIHVYDTLLCLSAIYPPPRPKQSQSDARSERMGAAAKWYMGSKKRTLLKHLHRVLSKVPQKTTEPIQR